MKQFGMLVFLNAFLLTYAVHGTEIDSFTDRDPQLKDSSSQLNRIINRYFEESLASANKAGTCNQDVLNAILNKRIRGLLWSPIEAEIEADVSIDKRHSLVEESVYRDFNVLESPTFAIAEIAAVVKIGEHYVGVDKLAHFLQLGYDLYRRHYIRNKDFRDVIGWSSWTEETYYGLLTTGIYSYGDLAANYDGLLFWEYITNTRLPKGASPYFICKDGRWRQQRLFDIAEYVTAAWDEGINCNRYKTSEMEKKVLARINELERKTGRTLQCPIVPEQCSVMIEHYGLVARDIITPRCFETH